jgi:GNAT superfamily N-acetyltransferase
MPTRRLAERFGWDFRASHPMRCFVVAAGAGLATIMRMAKLEVTVRPADAADVRPLAAVLARAFEDDPPFVWMLPDGRTRRARNRRFFDTLVRTEALAHGGVEVACAGDVIVGAAVWYPPGQWTAAMSLRTALGYLRAFGRRIGRASALSTAMARTHPHQPHWYLYAIGVDPARQGSGAGAALLRSRLARCDQAGQPAYLESSKLANVPLYEHFGFAVTGPMELPAGAPDLTPMWRPAAADRRD